MEPKQRCYRVRKRRDSNLYLLATSTVGNLRQADHIYQDVTLSRDESTSTASIVRSGLQRQPRCRQANTSSRTVVVGTHLRKTTIRLSCIVSDRGLDSPR